MKPRGLKGLDAQRTFIEWLDHEDWNVAKAGVRSKYQSQDLFGCFDAIAIRWEELGHGDGGWDSDWSVWCVQVTTQSPSGSGTNKSDRRRKIEAFACPESWRRSIVTHERVPDPADRKRSMNYWRIEDYLGDGRWKKPVAVQFDLAALDEIKKRASDAKHEEEMNEIRARIAKKEKAS